jgi:hypothetical protein
MQAVPCKLFDPTNLRQSLTVMARGKTSTKPEDVSPDWSDLDDKEKSTLNDWNTFFSKRYNVVGKVEGATNTDDGTL